MKLDSVRTLFLIRDMPYPPLGGAPLRNWQNINIMMKFGSVGVFSVFKWNPNRNTLPGVALWHHYNIAQSLSLGEKLERRVWWLRPHGNPDVDWTYRNAAVRELDEVLAKFQPHLVIFEEVWLYRYLPVIKHYGCRIIFDEHNVEAALCKQKYDLVQGLRSRIKAKIQLPKIKSIEYDFVHKADQVWTCSDNEARLVNDLYGHVQKIHVIPNGMNVAYYDCVRMGQSNPPEGLEQTYQSLIFVGLLSYAPNTEAAELLIDQIYPQLRKIYSNCRLLLVGRNPNQRIQEAGKRDPGIVVTGGVSDVRPYLGASSVVVVPLLRGGGTRLKILEAFASGRPVVSTAKGAEGLKAKDGEHLLIRNSVEEIVAGVCQLWSEPALIERLTCCAYELVQAEYSWEAVGRRAERAIQELLE